MYILYSVMDINEFQLEFIFYIFFNFDGDFSIIISCILFPQYAFFMFLVYVVVIVLRNLCSIF